MCPRGTLQRFGGGGGAGSRPSSSPRNVRRIPVEKSFSGLAVSRSTIEYHKDIAGVTGLLGKILRDGEVQRINA